MKDRIVISSNSSISALGHREEEVRIALQSKHHHLCQNQRGDWIGELPSLSMAEVEEYVQSNPKYKLLDRTAHLAMWTAGDAWQKRLKKGPFPRGQGV